MKHFNKYLVVASILISLISCNDTKNKSQSSDQNLADSNAIAQQSNLLLRFGCIGTYNLVLDTQTGKDMNTKFTTLYNIKPENKLITEFWIDAHVIQMFEKHLSDPKKNYDGVYFANTSNSTKVNSITLIPTVPNELSKDSHYYSWDAVKDIGTNSYQFKSFNKGQKTTNVEMNNFDTQYVKTITDPDKQLSKGVWFSACLFNSLVGFISANNISGVKVFQSAYLDFNENADSLGQLVKHQSTFVIVPTVLDRATGKHEEDWDIIKQTKNLKYFNLVDSSIEKNVKATYSIRAAYNHGQLCPRLCPTDTTKQTP